MTVTEQLDGVSMVQSIEDVLLDAAGEADELGTMPPRIVDALWSSGLMHWMNPEAAAGQEPPVSEMLETWKALARLDASVGWIGIANFPSAAFAAAFLPDAGFDEVFVQNDHRVTLGGQYAPNGVGEVCDGGYRLSGQWNFGSGTGHAEYVVGGFLPFADGEMVVDDAGMPELLVAVMPRDEITFADNWDVTGLRGTGSYDYNVADVFVPDHRVYPLFVNEPRRGGAIYSMGILPLTAAGHAAWALGVARGALDDIMALAMEKTRMGDETSVAHKLTFQRDLAHHEAMWRAADAAVAAVYRDAVTLVEGGAKLTPNLRADLRLSATYATECAKEIVQFVHLAAGTSAIRAGSRLERAFRDIYTGSQHAFINEKTYTDSAKLMLGLLEDSYSV